MCKVGDIILIDNYISDGKTLYRHSFIVLSDENGEIQGLSYDIICNVMSSFKNEEQKKKKLSYPGNFPISHNDTIVKNGNEIDGYIKAEQLYYFNKSKSSYRVIGALKDDIFELVMEFIEDELTVDIEHITDNL